MVKKPTFKLLAEGKDITSTIAANLKSLTYTDKEGAESDEISFVVHGLYKKPMFGSKLQLSLGYEGSKLYNCGSFNTQTVERDYKDHTTEVRATAVNFASPQKEKKSHLWENTTLNDIARTIASNNKLALSVDDTQNMQIASEMQDNINDIEFLYKLCVKYGYFMMQKDNKIVIQSKDSKAEPKSEPLKKNANLPTYELSIDECTALRITDANRNSYDAVIVEWQDTTDAKTKMITVGSGEQIFKLKVAQPKSDAEAVKQGEAKLNELQRGGVNGSLETLGANIKAGGKLKIKDLYQEFSIKEVVHSIDSSSYTLSIEFEG